MGRLLDELPLAGIAVIAAMLALVPFGQSHLVEKIGMLASGTLTRPIDIFDLFMHGAPSLVLIAKLVRMAAARGKG